MSIRRGDARIPYRQKRKGVPNSTGAICSAFPGCAKLNPGILVSSEWRVSFVASVENPPLLSLPPPQTALSFGAPALFSGHRHSSTKDEFMFSSSPEYIQVVH